MKNQFFIFINFLIIAMVAFFLSGCVSTQKDISISVEETNAFGIVTEFEERLILLDGEFLVNGKLSPEQIKEVNSICEEIDKSLGTAMLDKVVQSRLFALKGRGMLLAGKKSAAAKIYSQAKKIFENDVQLVILGRRLGEISGVSSYKEKFESQAIVVESAIESFEKGEFDIAAGLFDAAFLASNGFYTKAYSAIRQRAWDLKNVELGDGGNIDFWLSPQITVAQMMEIAQQRPNLLDNYTGAKTLNSKALFQALIKAGLMDCVSATDGAEIEHIFENTTATRILAARFLWNLYTNKNNLNATKYSKRYRSRENTKSPVADVDISSEDFDAVLGAVENEIMSLIDGKNFNPQGKVTAPEFDGYVKKVE